MVMIGIAIILLILPFIGYQVLFYIINKISLSKGKRKFYINTIVVLFVFILGELHFINLFGNEIIQDNNLDTKSNLSLFFNKSFYSGEMLGLHIFGVTASMLSLLFSYRLNTNN